jgi:ankyrin repeat protein
MFGAEIHDAARDGDLAKLRLLLEKNPSLVSTKDDVGMTPLIWAAANNHREALEFLLNHGADVHAKEDNVIGPAALSAAVGQTKFERNSKEAGGLTALGAAVLFDHRDLAKLLLAHQSESDTKDIQGWTPLHWAVILNHKDVADLLLMSGADVNVKDESGYTP